MTEAIGACVAGGFQIVTSFDNDVRYTLLIYPDKNNDKLQAEGKPAFYYWVPNDVRIARKGDTGNFMFQLMNFSGVLKEGTTVGVTGTEEVAGGVLTFSTTLSPPAAVLEQTLERIIEMVRSNPILSGSKYWAIRNNAKPRLGPVEIVKNVTWLSNLSPEAEGTMPASGGTPIPTPGSGSPSTTDPSKSANGERFVMEPRLLENHPKTVRLDDIDTRSNLSLWYWKMQGAGAGNLNPLGTNGFTGLIGAIPTAILWQGFHGAYSPIVVACAMQIPIWSEDIILTIQGDWSRIYDHFSAAGGVSYWFSSAQIQYEFNKLVTNGDLTVELTIDGTRPGADKLIEEINKRKEAIIKVFNDQAQKSIFDAPDPKTDPATAPSKPFFGFGASFALKMKKDIKEVHLKYTEKITNRYLMESTASTALEGFYDEIAKDPEAERKYFIKLYLEDFNQKISRIIKPVVRWPDLGLLDIGDPVSFISAQCGYPDTNGSIMWDGHIFGKESENDQKGWLTAYAKKDLADVLNPPPNWKPSDTFIKRKIHFMEPPKESENPYSHIFIEKNEVDLDPGENGTLVNDITLEIRADMVGLLDVTPSLDVLLETANQMIEVEFQCLGKKDDGNDRAITRFTWKYEDQDKPRYWRIYTGQMSFVPKFRYRVHVTVRGSIFTKGMYWYSDWIETSGNGAFMIRVPTTDDPGVTRRSLETNEVSGTGGGSGGGSTDPGTGGGSGGGSTDPGTGGGSGGGSTDPQKAGTKTKNAEDLTIKGFKVSENEKSTSKKDLSNESKPASPPSYPAPSSKEIDEKSSKYTEGSKELKRLVPTSGWKVVRITKNSAS